MDTIDRERRQLPPPPPGVDTDLLEKLLKKKI